MQTRTVLSTDVRPQIGRIIEDSMKGIVTVIQRYKRPVVAVIQYDRFKQLEAAERKLINAGFESIADVETMSKEEFINAIST